MPSHVRGLWGLRCASHCTASQPCLWNLLPLEPAAALVPGTKRRPRAPVFTVYQLRAQEETVKLVTLPLLILLSLGLEKPLFLPTLSHI